MKRLVLRLISIAALFAILLPHGSLAASQVPAWRRPGDANGSDHRIYLPRR